MLRNLLMRFQFLLIKKNTDGLDDNEMDELFNLMDKVPNAKRVALEYRKKIKNREMDPLSNPDDAGDSWLAVEDLVNRRDFNKTWSNWQVAGMAAAVMTVICCVGFFHSKQVLKQEKEQQAINSKSVQLKLYNGKVIPLSDTTIKTIGANTLQFSANNRMMDVHNLGTPETNTGMNELRTPAKLDYTMTLPDGTLVRLNASTIIRFPSSFGSKRSVYVDGEAFFKIAPDAAHPFIVNTPNGVINVLGTEFNVNTYTRGELRTSLIKGSVDIVYNNKHTVLKPGKQAVLTEQRVSLNTFEKPITLSWMNGKFFFHDTPLSEIAVMIPRWFDVEVVFDEPGLMKKQFSGCMDKYQSVNAFLDALKYTTVLDYYYKEGKVHITQPPR